jgi:tripartite-type tricarboxylate transporter receptor subunit TctC
VHIGSTPGGGYDLYGRLAAAYLGRHIPGNPTVVPKNMPGAGGFRLANWLYNAAPKDGTALGTAPQALAIEQVMNAKGLQFEADKFTWIGRMAPVVEIMYTWHTSPTRTIDDARNRETIMGGTSPKSPTITYLYQLNTLAGTKFKPIAGFKSTTDAGLAIERGEIEGTIKSWASMKVSNADWLKEKKVNLLVQFAEEKSPDMPDVPLMTELGKSNDDREAMRFFAAGNAMGRSLMAPPGIAADRAKALQTAFMAAMTDPQLLAETAKRKIDIGPMSGPDLAKIVKRTLSVSKEVIARAESARDASVASPPEKRK